MTLDCDERGQLISTALRPIERWTRGAKLLAFGLLAVVLWGAYAYLLQLRYGLGVTGLDSPIFWGIYITDFVFFIGISYGGTLTSGILRVTGAEWRKPLTRMAEAIAVFALVVGPINVIFDLGRPDRIPNLFKHSHFTSPLLWDVYAIGAYFVASVAYLYLPLIPDIAIIRDQYPQRRFYRWLALGWCETEAQRRLLKRAIATMAVLIIPLAITVHTVVAWVFAMTVQPMWHSTIFGPYFVMGAIYSGVATLLVAIAVIRRVYHLEQFVQPKHFEYLGYLLLTLAALWGYFTFAEYLTTYYGAQPDEMRVFRAKVSGEFAGMFWFMVYSMVGVFLTLTLPLIPAPRRRRGAMLVRVLPLVLAGAAILACVVVGRLYLQSARAEHTASSPASPSPWSLPALGYHGIALMFLMFLVWSFADVLRARPVLRIVLASVLVNIGMWLERYIIVVPSLSHPRLPLGVIVYSPTWIEWSLTAANFALFALLFLIFSRYFPMLPIWEMQGEEGAAAPAPALITGHRSSPAPPI
jgi:Ni/Fe-hydrogenase subunit HybB-like protein